MTRTSMYRYKAPLCTFLLTDRLTDRWTVPDAYACVFAIVILYA